MSITRLLRSRWEADAGRFIFLLLVNACFLKFRCVVFLRYFIQTSDKPNAFLSWEIKLAKFEDFSDATDDIAVSYRNMRDFHSCAARPSNLIFKI